MNTESSNTQQIDEYSFLDTAEKAIGIAVEAIGRQRATMEALKVQRETREQVLDAPALVGSAVFGEGIPWRMVVGAAQRQHKHRDQIRANAALEAARQHDGGWEFGLPPEGIDIAWVTVERSSWGRSIERETLLAVRCDGDWCEPFGYKVGASLNETIFDIIAWKPYAIPEPYQHPVFRNPGPLAAEDVGDITLIEIGGDHQCTKRTVTADELAAMGLQLGINLRTAEALAEDYKKHEGDDDIELA